VTITVADVLGVAKSQVGTQETRNDGHWVNDSKYNKWYGPIPGYARGGMDYPWCAVFVAWVADKAGAASLYPKTAGCETAVAWFKNKNRFSEYPAIGAQVFYGSGGGSHTGLVYAYDATYIYTVEGNTNTSGSAEGDGVYLKKRSRKDAYVYGYGYPAYPAGIVTADPTWKNPSSPEDDVALTTDDIAKIADAVFKKIAAGDGVLEGADLQRIWSADAVPAARPPYHNTDYFKADGKTPNNTNWTAGYTQQTQTEGIRETLARVKDLQGRAGSAVLTDAQVTALAAQVAASSGLVDLIAEKVAANLADRLAQ
jgi:hypothetical protein